MKIIRYERLSFGDSGHTRAITIGPLFRLCMTSALGTGAVSVTLFWRRR